MTKNTSNLFVLSVKSKLKRRESFHTTSLYKKKSIYPHSMRVFVPPVKANKG